MKKSLKKIKKIKCFFGFHNWSYDHPDKNIHRLCLNCYKEQKYIINGANGGMNKIWIDCENYVPSPNEMMHDFERYELARLRKQLQQKLYPNNTQNN